MKRLGLLLGIVVLLSGCAGNAQLINALACDNAVVGITGFYAHLGTSVDPSTMTPKIGLTLAHGTLWRIGNHDNVSVNTGSSVSQGMQAAAATGGVPTTTNAGQGSLTITASGTDGVHARCGALTAPAPVSK